MRLKPGTKHRCPEGRINARTAKVRYVLKEIPGGLMMASDLRGCLYWNIKDVEVCNETINT